MRRVTLSPKTRDVLRLLAAGVVISTVFLAPGATVGIHAVLQEYKRLKREKDLREWEKYNLPRLRYLLRRLQKQKIIEIEEQGGASIVKLTEQGKLRALKYRLEEMEIEKPAKWDGMWRLIIYDIAKFKKREQELFRRMIKKLKMLQLQKSVYLYPYPCADEVEFLRQYFDVSDEVLYLTVKKLENDALYRRYFGLS